MKNINKFIALCLTLCTAVATSQTQRYLSPVFDNVDIQTNIQYASNYTVITVPTTGHTSLQPLFFDLYTPTGDIETNRPLVLFFRTGNFLPNPQNGLVTGTKNDSITVELCTRLAKMGYVVANVDYRIGWNPISINQFIITSTLINAVYRGVQDSRACVRFFRKSVVEEGNPYGICPEKVTVFGEGKGGWVALATASLDEYSDLLTPKFIGPDFTPYITEAINGDLNGEMLTGLNPLNGDTMAIPNNPGYSSEFQLCVNMAGAIADSSWIDVEDPPFISFHVPNDPIDPYGEGILIIHPGNYIMEVQGSHVVAQKANALGNNQVFVDANIQDEFTTAANNFNNGYEGLFPFLRPSWPNPFNPLGEPLNESAPWQWWDEAYWSQVPHPDCPPSLPISECNFHVMNWIYQQDMSATKGRTYADSIIGYFAPRAFAALNLNSSACVNELKEPENDPIIHLSISPNPATNEVTFNSQLNQPIQSLQFFNQSGQLVSSIANINSDSYHWTRHGIPAGIYFAKIAFEDGVLVRKVFLKQ